MKKLILPAIAIGWFALAVLIIIMGKNAHAAPTPQQPAQQQVCAPLPQLRASLKAAGELELSGGMIDELRVMIVFAGPKTWTLVVVGADGGACVAANGTGWFEGKRHGPDWNRI